ncbi:RNA pseudouridylate synthase domain-containing protein 2-like [Planoprotostelium fungivorum]|uniref:RNA pseudouridylate synthase domain-containing protein 2-like n=1 Tax=Planoprotostelium fungivorum TaxID=1890364 RepID=A0A2P6N5T8_9EUKA|nr:RNA pseudouridylate synthase domain-containing protein 2-like [Planoprotostelium fungivorum]
MSTAGDTNKRHSNSPSDASAKRRKIVNRTKPDGLTREQLDETTCYIKDGLRHVNPYYFNFKTFTKGRWVNRKILDVMVSEFSGHDEDYYKKKIKNGDIRINDEIIQEDTLLRHGDELSHRTHRHEPPVVANDIQFIHTDDDLIVIDKPASIPVHPCGRYRHNTVLYVLAKEHSLDHLHPIYRLDRLTSGILVLARSAKIAAKYGGMMEDKLIQKEYLAKVDGNFPDEEQDVDAAIVVQRGGNVINTVSSEGKESRTIFQKMSYDPEEDTSIIRVHLHHLGHPISNDPLYGRGKKSSLSSENNITPQEASDPDCPECMRPHLAPDEEQLSLYLHAHRYSTPQWSYETQFPPWAKTKTETSSTTSQT